MKSPYILYEGIIDPQGGESVAKDWQFNRGESTSFQFLVLISSPIPNETAALRMFLRNFAVGSWNDLWGITKDEAVAVGTIGGKAVVMTTTDGDTWSSDTLSAASGELHGVWASDLNNVWAVGTNTNVWHWDGADWELRNTGIVSGARVYGVWGTPDGQSVYVVAVNGDGNANDTTRVYVSQRDGDDWTDWAETSGGYVSSDARMTRIHGTSASNIWIAGSQDEFGDARVFRWNGSTWSWASPDGNLPRLLDIWVLSEADAWAVGENGTILRTTDGGESWEDMYADQFSSMYPSNVNTVWAPDPNFVWIGLEGGASEITIWHYDGGTAYPVEALDHQFFTIRAIGGSSVDNAWMIGGTPYAHRIAR